MGRIGMAFSSRTSGPASSAAEVERDGDPTNGTGSTRSLKISSSIRGMWFGSLDEFSCGHSGDRQGLKVGLLNRITLSDRRRASFGKMEKCGEDKPIVQILHQSVRRPEALKQPAQGGVDSLQLTFSRRQPSSAFFQVKMASPGPSRGLAMETLSRASTLARTSA